MRMLSKFHQTSQYWISIFGIFIESCVGTTVARIGQIWINIINVNIIRMQRNGCIQQRHACSRDTRVFAVTR